VRVSLISPAPDQPAQLAFNIRDTGEGIPTDRIVRLFRPFSQADSSTTRRFGGSGLGLAISRSLAQLLGGDIELTSTSPRGSTFRFTIQSKPCAAPEERHALISVPVPAAKLEGRHALIVDDNGANRRILENQLQRWGLACHACATPGMAIAHLREKGGIDVVLLDMMMPDMNGVELGAELHRLPGHGNLPLILLSSVTRDEMRAFDPAENFKVVLTKPVRQAALLEALHKALADAPPVDPSRPATAPTVTAPKLDPTVARDHPLRIIVAEDNIVNQKLITRLLQRLGYQMQLTNNGLACLEAVRRGNYDLVLMDCQMPEMDGYETTRRIRKGDAGDRNRELHIIALTASAMDGDRERCLKAGMNDYLTKPVQATDLVRLINLVPALPDGPAGPSIRTKPA